MFNIRAVARVVGKTEVKTLVVYINLKGDLILSGSGALTSKDTKANILAIYAE